jgi:HEXXH motif-containing protein
LPIEECLDGLEEYLEGGSVPTVPVADGVHLALEDSNPLAMVEAHPDKAGNALDLGGRDVDVWVQSLRDALDVVAFALPEWTAGIQPQALGRILPVGYDDREHRSASYREAPGSAYLSLHPDPLTMAEALVHEGQHSALNLLSHFDPLLKDAPDVLVSSPVRPDPRPLRGVLLAVHAFVPVAALHLRLAAAGRPLGPRFVERRREVLQSNADALATLDAHGHPTELGGRVIRDLRALHQAVCTTVVE